MAAFDATVDEITACVETLAARGRRVRRFACAGSAEALAARVPVRIGPGANSGILLRSDTFIELGSPEVGSCAFVVWTDGASRVTDGRITLVGPDIPEAPGASLPFGQVLLLAGDGLGAQDHPALERAQHVADQVEGYMVRSSSESMWGRVSNDAAAKGFRFETLGTCLMSLTKAAVAGVQSVEVLFVTSGKEDLQPLQSIASRIHEAGREILREQWKAKGYDLDCDFDCGSCHDQQVCDDIREVIVERRKRARRSSQGAS